MKILLLHNYRGPATVTNRNLFEALKDFLSEKHDCRVFENFLAPRLFFQTLHLRAQNFFWADVIILHTYALFSLDLIVLSKLLGKQTIVFAWDEYPVSLRGISDTPKFIERVRNWLEQFALKMVSNRVVPTEDFRLALRSDCYVCPLWPNPALGLEPQRSTQLRPDPDRIKIAFAGNINLYRGLDDCIRQIDECAVHPVEVHIFSKDDVDTSRLSALKSVTLIHRGFMIREKLQLEMNEMHFGLISLHPLFDSAAFPSKIFDYAACEMPVLYFGPDLVHFINLVESSGIGVSLVGAQKIDFVCLYRELMETYCESLIKFRAMTMLEWRRFDKIL